MDYDILESAIAARDWRSVRKMARAAKDDIRACLAEIASLLVSISVGERHGLNIAAQIALLQTRHEELKRGELRVAEVAKVLEARDLALNRKRRTLSEAAVEAYDFSVTNDLCRRTKKRGNGDE